MSSIANSAFSIPRRGQRYPLMLPLRVFIRRFRDRFTRPGGTVAETITTNISSTGCYFHLAEEPGIQDRVEMEIMIHPDGSASPAGKAVCRGRVVRVEPRREDGMVGVACTIDHYRLLPTLWDSAESRN